MRVIAQISLVGNSQFPQPMEPLLLEPILDKAVEIGLTDVRFSIPWVYTQEISNAFITHVVSRTDTIIQMCNDRGLGPWALVAGATPCWASSQAGKNCANNVTREAAWGFAPTLLADVTAVATAYCDRWALAGIEVQNEPNHPDPPWAQTPAECKALTEAFWNGVKASTRPNTKVIAPSLADVTILNAVQYLTDLYAAGIKGKFDYLSHHPYCLDQTNINDWIQYNPIPDLQNRIEAIRAVMTANADAVPMVINEFGYASAYPTAAMRLVSETQKALWTADGLRVQSTIPYIEIAGFFSFYEMDLPGFSVVDDDGNEKESYSIIKEAVQDLRAL